MSEWESGESEWGRVSGESGESGWGEWESE